MSSLRENTPQTQNAGVGFTRPFRACKTTPAVRKISPIFPTAFAGGNTLHFALQSRVTDVPSGLP